MVILYEKKGKEAAVWRCFDYGAEAEIPEFIDGHPVTELAPYAFSAHMDEHALWEGQKTGKLSVWGDGKPPALMGPALKAVSLPPALKKIGAYAFYNCSELEMFSFYRTLSDLGPGLFTGCHRIRKLSLTLDETEVSCLKEILLEVPEKLEAEIHGPKEARLIFPEFYEESVENTPARILMIQMHGSGMNFRNSFLAKRLDYRSYDACFYMAKAKEDFDTVSDMVFSRLCFPAGLSKERKEDYEAWLFEHLEEVLAKTTAKKQMDRLVYLADRFLLPKKQTEGGEALRTEECLSLETVCGYFQRAAALAAEHGFAEGTAYLMDCIRRCDRKPEGTENKKKRFAL